MAMVTELELQKQVVVGGERVAVHKWTVQNAHVHQLCEVLSRLQIAMLEMDSNNSTGGMVLYDSEAINSDWKRFKYEWMLAKKYKHLAPAAQEKLFAVLAITDNESLRTVNVRIRRLVQAVTTLLCKMLFSDSAKLQYGLTDMDVKKLEEHHAYVEEVLSAYVGEGLADKLGMEVAAHEHVGIIVPPINLHQAIVAEPSPAGGQSPGPDSPDTPSTVPSPGTSTEPVK